MLKQELQIEITALCEQLQKYNGLSQTYIVETKNAMQQTDLKKLIFCLSKISSEFENDSEYEFTRDSNYKELQLIIAKLNNHLKDSATREKEIVPLMCFWTSFNTWLDNEGEDPAELYSINYQDGYHDWGRWWTIAKYDLNQIYKIRYGKNYQVVNEENISFELIKEFIEAFYWEVVEIKKGRLKLTIKVNELFARFQIPYKLKKGKLVKLGYRTSYIIDEILNYEQFERKIEYASEMIVHKDFLDKHSALNYIADAFCYFISLFKDNKSIIEMVDIDNNSAVYSEIKAEITTIRRLINDVFDIRHNEKYATKREGNVPKREALNDPIFVEYLYNRINAALSLLQIKKNQMIKKDKDIIE